VGKLAEVLGLDSAYGSAACCRVENAHQVEHKDTLKERYEQECGEVTTRKNDSGRAEKIWS